MVGNDVVDICCALKENIWRRKGFLNKVFTEDEHGYILNSDQPDKIVWLLWSMKESAYKIYVRQFRKRFFAPLKFVCTLNNDQGGEVSGEDAKYDTSSEVSSNLISTIAVRKNENKRRLIVKENIELSNTDYYTQHHEVKVAVLKSISSFTNIPLPELEIKKNESGIPDLFHKHRQIDINLSISHHGHYGAFAIAY